MKQVLQDVGTGKIGVLEVPAPAVQRGRLLVRTAASLISAGTEKMVVDSGKQSLLSKAKERPDLVRQVIDKARTEGIMNTFTAVRAKLDSKNPLGYSAAGVVTAVGEGVTGFSVGDRVACAGVGYASHAEVLSVPKNLCVRIPHELSFDQGCFATLGAIALQGLRLADPTLGESVVVIGLGLLGQIAVQLLRANGCRVFGIDLDAEKLTLAQELGADDASLPDEARQRVRDWSRGRGADAVLITAGTSSNDPITMAGDISRQKGRVVVVGMVGMDVPRGPYFSKELSLQISMSYGPGRYDTEYEERGQDYPFGYVRWTEGRNLEAFLDLAANGSLQLERLITHRFSIDRGEDAYKLITGETKEPYLGIVLQYDTERSIEERIEITRRPAAKQDKVVVGMIGAGGYARGMLLPAFRSNGVDLRSVNTASGVTATNVAREFGFASAVSSPDLILGDEAINLVVIATPHDTHAELARRALERGKHVFVEKPLALNDSELDEVLAEAETSSGRLMVGFNRRFSPAAQQAKEFFTGHKGPLSILYRVSGGRIARDHWLQDPATGGGRIIGEVCHFIDTMHYLTGAVTTRVFAESINSSDHAVTDEDSVFISLKFSDGSIAYVSEGDKALPKERIEIFGGGKTFVVDDFRSTAAYSGGKDAVTTFAKQDKGQREEIRRVCSVVLDGGESPIALQDLKATSQATFRIIDSLRSGSSVDV
jgi:predicted dehydrogenase/threonine dehydrogenase-like Zn-dependent dehydrogenase